MITTTTSSSINVNRARHASSAEALRDIAGVKCTSTEPSESKICAGC